MFGHWHTRRCFHHPWRGRGYAARCPRSAGKGAEGARTPPVDSKHLTLRNHGVVIRDPEGRDVGGLIGLPSGRYALWLGPLKVGGRRKVGEFATAAEAEAAAEAAAVVQKVKRNGPLAGREQGAAS